MTLATLLADIPPLATLRGLWLVFPASMGDALAAAQSDQTRHRAEPITLTDGRLALCADLLSEIHPGGLFHVAFGRLTPSAFSDVAVIDGTDFQLLIPSQDS